MHTILYCLSYSLVIASIIYVIIQVIYYVQYYLYFGHISYFNFKINDKSYDYILLLNAASLNSPFGL